MVFKLSQTLGEGTLKQYRAIISKSIPRTVNSKILDIGCGNGAFSDFFECNYFGVDINPAYIEAASERYKGAFFVSDSSVLAFNDDTFDQTVSIAVFHHLSDQQVLETIAEGLRVCKPGGYFHIVEAIYPRACWNLLKHGIFAADRGRHQRHYEELLEVVASRFEVKSSYFSTGFPHDTCYIRVKNSIV